MESYTSRNNNVLDNDVETCPWSMTRTRSHCSTVRIECAMMMSVQSQNVCRIVSCTRDAVSESSDDVASSSTTIYTTPTRTTIMLCQLLHLLRVRLNQRFFGRNFDNVINQLSTKFGMCMNCVKTILQWCDETTETYREKYTR